MRTKCNRMDLIRNLNLWGNDLCQIGPLKQMPNLEVLSLSVNRIASLADLRSCLKLTELYLRKNNIYDLNEVRHLRGLKQLKVLWLSDNPCATLPGYRFYVLHHIPWLVKLDSEDVTEEERRQAARQDVDQMQTSAEPEYDYSPIVEQPQRRASAPDVQEDMLRDRRLPSGGMGRRSMPVAGAGGYEDQYPDQADFQMQQGGPYHGHLDRASTSGMAYEDHTPDHSPRGAEPRHAISMPAVGSGYGHMAEPAGANMRRSGGLGDSYEAGVHQHPSSAWASADSPETPMRAWQGDSGGERGGGQQGSRYNSDDRGGMPHGDPYMYRSDPDGDVQAEPDDPAAGAGGARADNILCAVLALIKELDQQGLELVRRAIEQRQTEL